MPGPRVALLGVLTLLLARIPAQVASLSELAQIARERFEASKQAQLAALQPFLRDLELSYDDRDNREYLDGRFLTIAALGDSIVPALLERLTPADEADGTARNAAANSARVLRLLDASGFADSLLELAESKSPAARLHALRLLGYTRSHSAAKALTRMLDGLTGAQQVAAVDSLARLKAAEPAVRIAELLGSGDERLREAALGYLAATCAPAALPIVLQALRTETRPDAIPGYVRYLEGAAPQSQEAADALLPLLDSQALDRSQVTQVCRALARVAPRGHAATIAACKGILQAEESGSLGLAAALTMRELGDASGVKVLLDRLNALVGKARRDDLPFIYRADLLFALERWERAARDYEAAIERSDSTSVREGLYLTLARCEARLKRWDAVHKALRDSGAGSQAIQRLMAEDPALARGLRQPAIRKLLESLGKGGGR